MQFTYITCAHKIMDIPFINMSIYFYFVFLFSLELCIQEKQYDDYDVVTRVKYGVGFMFKLG